MECKKCGLDLSGKEYKNVAQWPFCMGCFNALMEKAEAKKDERVEIPAPEVEPPVEKDQCLVCEKEIEKGTGREMLGLMFCRECHENLVRKPVFAPRALNSDNERDMFHLKKPAVPQVRVDLKSPVQCHGCGRQIPAIGSKQFDNHPYCPDCYYRLPEIIARKPKPFATVVAGQPSKEGEAGADVGGHEGGVICQACRRQVLPGNLKTVEGFEICMACLTADRETALEIARARHRNVLEKIKKEIAD